jgi:hypothetical protein
VILISSKPNYYDYFVLGYSMSSMGFYGVHYSLHIKENPWVSIGTIWLENRDGEFNEL